MLRCLRPQRGQRGEYRLSRQPISIENAFLPKESNEFSYSYFNPGPVLKYRVEPQAEESPLVGQPALQQC